VGGKEEAFGKFVELMGESCEGLGEVVLEAWRPDVYY
jgi:hypothetical protein